MFLEHSVVFLGGTVLARSL